MAPSTVGIEISPVPAADRPASPWLTNGRAWGVLIAFLALIFLGNVLWLHADQAPPAWDASRYLVNSLEAYDQLRQPSLAALKELYFVRNTVRPSIGFVLPAALFYFVFGPSPDVATLWTNGLLLAIVVFSVYGIGNRLFDVRVGLLAAILIGLNLELVRLSRIFWPELSVAAVASLAVYLLILSDFLRRKVFVFLAGLVLGIGMMQRPIFPAIFLAGPLAFVFIGSLVASKDKGDESLVHRLVYRVVPATILFALPVVLIDWPFYREYGLQMLDYIRAFQGSDTFAPVTNPYSLQSLVWYLFNLNRSVSWPFHVLYVAGLVVFISALAMRRAPAASAILLAWVLVPYVALSLTSSKGFSYLSSLYPALTLFLAFAVFFVFQKRRQMQLVASAVLVGLAILAYWQVSWGQPLPQELATRIWLGAESPYREDWHSEGIIAAIDEFVPVDKKVSVGVVSSLSYLSDPPLSYYARQRNPNITVIRVTDPFPTLVNAEFVVVKTGRAAVTDPPRTIQDKNAKLLSEMLKREDSIFYQTHMLIGRFPLPDGSEAIIYRRRVPLTSDEIKAVGDELVAASGDAFWGEEAASQVSARLQVQLQTGNELLNQQRYREALPFFQQAVKADPTNVDARQGLARCLYVLGNCDAGVEQQQTAVQLQPNNATYTLLGGILNECKRYDESIAAYLIGVELDPQGAYTHFALAQAYAAKGQREDAIAEFTKTIELDTEGQFTARAQDFIQRLQAQ